MTHPAASIDRAKAWLFPLIIVTAALLCLGGVVTHDFVLMDDPQNIALNDHFNPATLQGIAYYWMHGEYGLYIPLTNTVWWLLTFVGRVSPDPSGITLNPAVYHAMSLAVHLISSLLVYDIFARLLKDRRAALIGALFYALHPLQVEPVAWAAGLKDVMAGMFGLCAINGFIRARQSDRRMIVVATVAFICAMLSKPSALMVPAIALVIDRWLLSTSWRKSVITLWPWFGLSAGCAILGRIMQPAIGIPGGPIWARPLIVADSLAFYLWKVFVPIHLTIDYGHRPDIVLQQPWIYVSWLLPAVIAWVLIRRRQKSPELFTAGAIFAIAPFPVLGLMTFLYQYFSTTADHYVYLAMLGPALAAGWVVQRWNSRIIYPAAIAVLIFLGSLSFRQMQFWEEDFALFGHASELNPTSTLAVTNLGHAYAVAGHPELAEIEFQRAVSARPDYLEPRRFLAKAMEQRGDYSGAIEHRRAVLLYDLQRPREIQGDVLDDTKLLAQDLLVAGRANEARQFYAKALLMNPNDADARAAMAKATTAPVP